MLSDQPQNVDFSFYRSQLKNSAVIDEIERSFKQYKPATYDVERQVKAIESFETQAVKSAEETKSVVDQELKDLDKTLRNIEDARPFEDLTVVRSSTPDLWQRCTQLRLDMLIGITIGRCCRCETGH
jgi:hypothetical protein